MQHVEEGVGVLARPVVEGERDDVAVAGAVAELAAPARPPQAEAEVAGAPAAAGLAAEVRQRRGRLGAQAEDQLAPRLRELRPGQVVPGRRAAGAPRAGAGDAHGRQRAGESERAQDLACRQGQGAPGKPVRRLPSY